MDWQTKTLGEICDEANGVVKTGPFGSQLHESDYRSEGLPVVMPKDIINGKIATQSIARIGEADEKRLQHHKLKKGDIVYGRRGDIGRRALITEMEDGWLCGTGCLRISPGETVLDSTFLFYYLGHPEITAWIANRAIGATLPNLNTTILRSVPVKYPNLRTQKTIAALLAAYDDLIENNTRRIQILEQIAHDLYQQWFVYYRFPGYENTKFGDSELGSIPRGWEVQLIGDMCTYSRGKSYSSSELVADGGLPFLNLKCIERDGGFRHDGIKRFQGKYKESQTANAGDVIVAVTDMTQERRVIARAARIPETGAEIYVVSMDLVKINPKDGVPNDYLYSLFRYSSFADHVKQAANGANVLHLQPDHILAYKFICPSDEVIQRYAEQVKSLYQLQDLLQMKNEKLRQGRDLLLPRLISGELDVSTLEIQVEELETMEV